MVMGAGATGWAAAIHLHLWASGYRHIPTIGPLFLVQGIVGGLLTLAVLATRRVLPAAVSALFLLSTAAGLLLSDWVGLFGFHDHLDAPDATLSLVVECTGAVVLLGAVARRFLGGRAPRPSVRHRRPADHRRGR